MGNSRFRPSRGRTSDVFSSGYIEKEGLKLAPQVGFEPTTLLTAEPVVEHLRSRRASSWRDGPIRLRRIWRAGRTSQDKWWVVPHLRIPAPSLSWRMLGLVV